MVEPTRSRQFLAMEWAVLFVFFPMLAYSEWLSVSRYLIFAPPMLYAIWLERNHFRLSAPVAQPMRVGGLVLRIALITAALFGSAYWLLADQFLYLPRHLFAIWILVVVLYPVLSALPQEILYRQFYFRRYAALWPHPYALALTNIAVFALLHIQYDNWVAIVFTLVGGAIFTFSYQRTQRLRWVWLEHSAYGLALFTSGWGRFFYEAPR